MELLEPEFSAMLLVFAQGRGEAVRGTKLHDAARKHVQGKVLDSAELSALRDAAAAQAAALTLALTLTLTLT